jgi:myo-inositol catabolism protein IolC
MNTPQNDDFFVLAFDHRGTIQRGLYNIHDRAATPEEETAVRDAKKLIYDAFLAARKMAPEGTNLGVLVDEQFGADVARQAVADDVSLSIVVEESGRVDFDFEYGEDFGAHIEAFAPNYVKALVRYNSRGNAQINELQIKRVGELCEWLARRPIGLLLEIVVPATPEQLVEFGGDLDRYETELRPTLMREALAHFKAASVKPAFWKLEGLESSVEYQKVVDVVKDDLDSGVGFLVLGRAASDEVVEGWLRAAAPVKGYRGFAIGRTIWWPGLENFINGTWTREQAINDIASRFIHLIEVYESAKTE